MMDMPYQQKKKSEDTTSYVSSRKEDAEESNEPAQDLMRLLIASPYIDTDHAPEIEQKEEYMKVRISVRNKEHLHDLMRLLEDRNYVVNIL